MRLLISIGAVCAVLFFVPGVSGAQTMQSPDAAGVWLGTLQAGKPLRIEFIITRESDGALSAVIRSIDQAGMKIPVRDVTFSGDSLHVATTVLAKYAGKLSADGATMDGVWTQNGNSLPLVLTRQEKPLDAIRAPVRPQTPKKPYPYREEEVSYENAAAGVRFAGTLTLPEGKGPFPVALLLTCFGQQNRDEEMLGHRPFLVLSDWLTRQGIAVLRVDDRGVGGSTGDPTMCTTGDFADDALAGVAFLKGRPEIDPARIGLVGHSEGGTIAQIAASRSKDVAFIVTLAGPGQKFVDVLVIQNKALVENQGMGDAAVDWMREKLGTIYGILADSIDDAAAERKIRDYIATLSPEEQQRLAISDAKMQQMLSPWVRYSFRYDPRATLMKVTCPVLALNGGKDTRIPPKENLAGISEALVAGGNTHGTVKEIPGLNHRFQTCKTGDVSEYAAIEETMSPLALEAISEWIRNTCGMGDTAKEE